MSMGTGNDNNNDSEKIDKYLELSSELKKLWNKRATVIPISVGALGRVHKELYKNERNWKSVEKSRP